MTARLCAVLVVLGLAEIVPAQTPAETKTKTKGEATLDRMNKKTDQNAAKKKDQAMDSAERAGQQRDVTDRIDEIDKEAEQEKKLNAEAVKNLGPKANEPAVPKKAPPAKKP